MTTTIQTEKDTTQFSNNGNINIRKTGLGQTTAHGRNKVNMVQGVMALSGPDLQVPGKNGNGPPGPAKNNKNPRNVVMRSLERMGLIQKRATNVNKDYVSQPPHPH